MKARVSSTHNQLRPSNKSTIDLLTTTTSKRQTKRTVASSTSSFDPLQNVIHLPLSVQVNIDTISEQVSDSDLIDLFADFLPPAPSSFRGDRAWKIETQMRAAGFSPDILRKHCLKAAFSWGI